MKKIISVLLFTLCALMLFSCSKPDPVIKDIEDAEGNKIATGYYDEDGNLLYEEQADDLGRVTKKTSYDKDGRVSLVEEFVLEKKSVEAAYTYGKTDDDYSVKKTIYNNKGVCVSVRETKYEKSLVVSEVLTSLSSKGEVVNTEESTFKYNDDGTILEVITSDEKKIRETLRDDKDAVIYDHEFSSDGNSVKIYYDENGNAQKNEYYNVNGKLVSYMVTSYSENGKISRTETYNTDNNLVSYSDYYYREDGKMLKGIYKYNADGTINSTITYDEEGKATIHTGKLVSLN